MELGFQLYSTDFRLGWPQIEDEMYSFTPQEYGLLVGVTGVGAWFYTSVIKDTERFYAQVDVTPLSCPELAGYGLQFRVQDDANFYTYTVYCNGTYSVLAQEDGVWRGGISSGPLPNASLPADTNTGQRLALAGDGPNFTLFYNGYVVAQFRDDGFPDGDVGIYIDASRSQERLEVLYQHMEVWTLR